MNKTKKNGRTIFQCRIYLTKVNFYLVINLKQKKKYISLLKMYKFFRFVRLQYLQFT